MIALMADLFISVELARESLVIRMVHGDEKAGYDSSSSALDMFNLTSTSCIINTGCGNCPKHLRIDFSHFLWSCDRSHVTSLKSDGFVSAEDIRVPSFAESEDLS